MDSEALFKPSRRVLVDKNQEKKPLGIDPALVYAPLTYALTRRYSRIISFSERDLPGKMHWICVRVNSNWR